MTRAARMPIIRKGAGALGAVALALAVAVPALAATGTLPGGTTIAVDITTPADGAATPYGSAVPITGTASVGSTTATPNTALIYDIDVSGSTVATNTATPTSPSQCGNPDGDGLAGLTLDCEITSLVNLNAEAITRGTVAAVGAVALGGNAGGGSGVGDSIRGDVQPAGGLQALTTPAADLNGTGGVDISQVLTSAYVPGFRLFTNIPATNANTNYEDSVIVASATAGVSTAANKIVVLVSDGAATIGNAGLPGASPSGQFSTPTAFENWVRSVAGNVKFVTFAVGAQGVCAPSTWNPLGTLTAIAHATGGTCSVVSNPANLPDVLPSVINSQLVGLDVTVDGTPVPASVSDPLPQTGPANITWTSSATGLLPGPHQICATARGSDSGGSGQVQQCVTIDVRAVQAGGPYGGDAASVEGTPVAISATTAGGAAFDQWTAVPGVGVDPGASCAFANSTAASTTVSCTDDGTFVLTAHTTSPADARNANLVLGNAAPTLGVPTISPTGSVFAGSAVTVTGVFADLGTNDTHTCTVAWSDGPSTAGVVDPGALTCTASRTLDTVGNYSAVMTVQDDDGDSASRSTTEGANGTLSVIDLVITPGSGPGGSYSGVEGSAVLPSVSVPAGTTLQWSVAPSGPVTPWTACPVALATADSPSVTCNDNGTFTLSLDATLNGHTSHASLPMTIGNAAPVLAVPTVNPTGTVLTGTPVTVSGAFTDAGANDTHTCGVVWSDGPTQIGSVSGGVCSVTRTLSSAGSYAASMTVTDDDGDAATRSTSEGAGGSITVVNLTIASGTGPNGSYPGVEGSAVSPSANAPSGASLVWSAVPASGVDAGATCSFVGGSTATPLVTCTDDGTWTLKITATMGSFTASASIPMVLTNVTPVVGAPTLSASLVPINTAVTVSDAFADVGKNDSHTCTVLWDDGLAPVSGSVSETVGTGTGSCSRTSSFSTPGIYRVTTTVTDDDLSAGSGVYEYLVVYDPSAGFVTGGGTINVGSGSYAADPALTGKANFGFESKYQKGASTPTGNTEFQFHAASFNFHSTDYQWLVVSGAKAQYKGTGTVNGASGYGFLVTVTDGQVSGGGGVDKFRIKIWNTASGATVFDNAMGASTDIDSASPQAISGGSIVIHAAR